MSTLLAKLGLAPTLGTESFDNPMDQNAQGYLATGESESETASAAILDATKESAEIDEDLDDFDNTVEAIDDIDDQIEVAEIAVERNAYTPMLAAIQRIGLKNAFAKVTSRQNAIAAVDSIVMPAHENFEGAKGGTMAVESFKEAAGEMFSTLKKRLEEIIKRITDFLTGVFEASSRLKKRAEGLKARAKNAVEGNVKVTGASAIKVGDKLGKDALDGLKVVHAALGQALAQGEIDAAMASITGESPKVISFTGGTVPAELKSAAGNGSVTCSHEGSGGAVFATITGSGEDAFKLTANVVHKTANKGTPEESEALSSAECTQAINLVIDIANEVGKAKESAKAFDKGVKDIGKDKKEGERKDIQSRLVYARKVTSFRKDVVALALAAGNAMCNYVEASTKGGKEGKEDKGGDAGEGKKNPVATT